MPRAGSDESWARALNDALDQRDAERLSVQGARAILIALVHKFGPFELTANEIIAAHHQTIDVESVAAPMAPSGFRYSVARPRTTTLEVKGSE